MRLLLAALVALAAARDHALLEQLLELEADVSELTVTHTLERASRWKEAKKSFGKALGFSSKSKFSSTPDKKSEDDPGLTDEEREDAIGLAFGDEFKTGGAKQKDFTAGPYPGVENRAVSLTTLKKIKKWLDEAMNMKTAKRLQDERDFINSCQDDPTKICVSNGACLGKAYDDKKSYQQLVEEGGTCEGRLQRTAATADMNLLNDLLVKPITKQMWETTSKAAGYDESWKWDDPRWTQVAGSLAELLGPGPPDFFISHNWGGSFANFVAAVERHFETRVKGKLKGNDGEEKTEDNTFYWVCTFANNQHDPKHDIAEEGPADGWGFAKALNVAKSVVSIQDDTQVGSFTLYRAWCAFEFWWAMRKGYPIDILCAPKEDPTKEDPTRRNFVCGPDVCQRLKEFSINPAPESGLIVGMFASKWTDYGKIKDSMMKVDASWRPADKHPGDPQSPGDPPIQIAWKSDKPDPLKPTDPLLGGSGPPRTVHGVKPYPIPLTADIDAMKKRSDEVVEGFKTLGSLGRKTLSFLPTVREACDQCRLCAHQAPDVFQLAVHKLGEELECSAKTSRRVARRGAVSTAGGVAPVKTTSEIIRDALFGAKKRAQPTTIADLIGAYPHLHPFLYAEGDREASFRTLAELVASGKAPQTKLMVAMNDDMQLNEGTGAKEFLLVELNFNPDLELEKVLKLDEEHVDEYIGEMGRPAGKFICEYFDGTGGWKQNVYNAFKKYVGDLKRIAEEERQQRTTGGGDTLEAEWKRKIAKRHGEFMVEASNHEPFPKSYELFATNKDGGHFLLKESYALNEGTPNNKQRKAHDDELANGGVNGWAKYTMGFTAKAGVVKPKDLTPAPAKKPPTETSFATEADRDAHFKKMGGGAKIA